MKNSVNTIPRVVPQEQMRYAPLAEVPPQLRGAKHNTWKDHVALTIMSGGLYLLLLPILWNNGSARP